MFISNSVEETIAAGTAIGRRARAGEVIALVGDLGAGKTQLVKGIVNAIGCEFHATSPTFALLHEYRGGGIPVYHFDFYRLETADEALRLGLDDYLFGDGLTIIEWADRFPHLLPANTRWIRIAAENNERRTISQENA